MERPTDLLRCEHRVILRALSLLETAGGRADVADAWWLDAVTWIRVFVDLMHHAREERCLFPAMVAASVPNEGGPIGVMIAEHDEGRTLVRELDAADGGDRARIVRHFVALLRAHIAKEDDVLFPLADAVLDDDTHERIAVEFAALADELGPAASAMSAAQALDALLASLQTATSISLA
jgi:hemerythrin-like domain-containing protein